MEANVDLGNTDIDSIKTVDMPSAFDARKYEGTRWKIDQIEKRLETNFYPDGEKYDPNSKEKIYRVYIYTEPLRELNLDGSATDKVLTVTKDNKKTSIRVNARFNLQKDENGAPVISKSAKAKLWSFMKKLGATKLSELVGKYVLLTTEASKVEGDENIYLRIVQ